MPYGRYVTAPATRGDRILRAGVAITLIGCLLSLVAMLPLVAPGLTMPSVWWFLSMLTAVGVTTVSVGLVVTGRERRRRATR